MDESRLAQIQRDLVEWGIMEPARIEVTKRFRGAIMRATIGLQQEEQAGRRPAGHPVRNAVDGAFAAYPLPPGAVATDDHRAFVTAVEVAALPDAVRQMLGV
jgi:hypothetical protein